MLKQGRFNVESTYWRWIDIESTLFQRCVPAEIWICSNSHLFLLFLNIIWICSNSHLFLLSINIVSRWDTPGNFEKGDGYNQGAPHLAYNSSQMFLSFCINFSYASATVAWAILDRIFGFEPPSDMMDPRYVKLFSTSSLALFTLLIHSDSSGVCVII